MNPNIQAKNAYYFSHDSNARNDEKIISLRMKMGAEGYGIYFMLVEMMLESSDYQLSTNYLPLAFSLHIEEEKLKSVVEDFGLFEFTEDEGCFYSPSFIKRMKPLESLREQRRQAGIRSGEVRREKARQKAEQETNDENERTTLDETLNDRCPKTNKGKESRVEKRRVEDRIEEPDGTSLTTKATRFVPPQLKDIEAYCNERKNSVDATRFLDFYQSKGWMVGRNKMKDWQAAVRTWEREEKERQRQKTPNIANHNNEVEYEPF